MLRKMLHCPVYLDSSTLSDLRTLFTEGVPTLPQPHAPHICQLPHSPPSLSSRLPRLPQVHESDCIVLLATKGVLTRPWCLLELLESAIKVACSRSM